jgi:hypothetical protein
VNYTPTYSALYDPAFPQSTLDVRTELLLGGVWTDVSAQVLYRAGVQITRGHADETSTVQPSAAPLQINNHSGQFSPRNPLGVYYGLIGRNTPCRISLPEASCYLRMEQDSVSYVSCPDRPSLDITGNIDIRIEVRPSTYVNTLLACKSILPSQGAWYLETYNGAPTFAWSPDGVNYFDVTSTATLPLGRIAIRVTLAVATGTVTFYTAPTLAGTWTQLGAAASGTGGAATSIFNTPAPIQVGYNLGAMESGLPLPGFNGKIYGFQLYSGIAGTLVASPDFTAQVPGTAPFADGQANIWSFSGTAEISDRKYRHHGEVPAWPQRWDPTGNDIYVPIEPAGLLRRLTQGTPPIQSAMLRGYSTLTGAAAPVAYWACEDGSNSTVIASSLPVGAPMQVHGTPTFAANSSFVCSQAIPTLGGSTWTGAVGAWPSGATSNTTRFLMQVPAAGEANGSVIARMYTTGTVARMDLIYDTGGSLTATGYSGSGAQLFTNGPTVYPPAAINGGLLRVSMELKTSGGNITWSVAVLQVGATSAGIVSGTVTSASLGAVASVAVNPGGGLTSTAIGHISVQSAPTDLFGSMFGPLNANNGEAAGIRFARLCGEQGIAARVYGLAVDTVAMGYQSPNSIVSLLQECEDADRGLIYEPRQTLGLAYRTRASLYNQASAVTLSYTAAHLSPPITPTDDDQTAINDMTVTRSTGPITGSSSRQYLASGAMSVQPPPTGIGEYASQLSLNLATDPQAAQLAGWILNVGTVDAPRYPVLTLNLARSELTALTGAILDADVGDRVTVSSTPSFLPPDGISQILRGMSETLNTFTLTEALVCAPELPYRVGVYDDPVLGHYDTDGSSVYGNPSATATSIQVATTGAHSPLWTTAAGDFPFDIEVSLGGTSGERMTVTNITGSASPQTFTVVRSVNGVVRAWSTGADIRLFQPAIYSL